MYPVFQKVRIIWNYVESMGNLKQNEIYCKNSLPNSRRKLPKLNNESAHLLPALENGWRGGIYNNKLRIWIKL